MVPPSRDQPVGFSGGAAARHTHLAEVAVASSRACGRMAARRKGLSDFRRAGLIGVPAVKRLVTA